MNKIVIGVTASISAVLIKGQAKYLKENNYEVEVVSGYGEEIERLAIDEGVKLISVPFVREISLVKDIITLVHLINYLKKLRPNIVNAGTPKAGFLIMIAAYICRVPNRVFTMHGLRSTTLTGIKREVVYFTEKLSCALAHEVICVSHSLREEAVSSGILKRNKGKVLLKGSCNGVDIRKFNLKNILQNDLEEKIKKYDLEGSYTVIGFVGRMVKDKGVAELYWAFKKLSNDYKLKLILIGPNELDDTLPQEFYDELMNDVNVILIGKVNDLHTYYPLFDMLVLPSYREGFGNVIIESAAMGIPALASDIAGCKDAVDNNKTGLLFKSNSVEDLTDKLKFYLDNPDIRREHGIKAAERAMEFFPSEKIWNEQLKLYQGLLGANEIATKKITSV